MIGCYIMAYTASIMVGVAVMVCLTLSARPRFKYVIADRRIYENENFNYLHLNLSS